MQRSGGVDESSSGPAELGLDPFEQRLDEFAATAKDATALAVKIRTALNTLAQNATAGGITAAPAQIARLSETLAGLSAAVDRLAEESAGLHGGHLDTAGYARELEAALVAKGVSVTRGPEPYWLVYPAWYKIERSSKGFIEVILNGDRLDSARPSAVAATIAEVVGDKFNSKQLVDLLKGVRDLLRRAGATGTSLRLDDVYDVLALEPGKRAVRRKDFSKGEFYYSVHRLAGEMDRMSNPPLDFPRATSRINCSLAGTATVVDT